MDRNYCAQTVSQVTQVSIAFLIIYRPSIFMMISFENHREYNHEINCDNRLCIGRLLVSPGLGTGEWHHGTSR
jgi:hypothetical protein